MPSGIAEHLSFHANRDVVESLHRIARHDHRELEELLKTALKECVTRSELGAPDPQVLSAFEESLREFDSLYRDLAK